MMLLKTGQQKNPQNLKLERITNQKIQKLSKIHVYIVKYRRLNTWDTRLYGDERVNPYTNCYIKYRKV